MKMPSRLAHLTLAAVPVVVAVLAVGDLMESINERPLLQVAPETSIFVQVDLDFPADTSFGTERQEGDIRRLDAYQDGARIHFGKANSAAPYCVISTRLISSSGYSERVKRLTVTEAALTAPPAPVHGRTPPTVAPRGVMLHVSSVQENAITRFTCYPRKNGSAEELTVQTLRTAIGADHGDDRLSLLAPIEPPHLLIAADPAHGPAAKTGFREALTERPTGPRYRHMQDSHVSYLNYIHTIKDDQIYRKLAAPASAPPAPAR